MGIALFLCENGGTDFCSDEKLSDLECEDQIKSKVFLRLLNYRVGMSGIRL